jgi:hypothetical protein
LDVIPIPNTDDAADVNGVIFGIIPGGITLTIEASLSDMTCRFLKISVCSLKTIVITDRPGIDWDLIVSIPMVPPKFFSIGRVTSDSTKSDGRPGDSV